MKTKLLAGWTMRNIGDFAKVVTGGTPNTAEPRYWNGNIQWMSSGEINDARIRNTKKHITPLGLNNSSTRLLPPGSVMVALAGQGRTRGMAAILETQTTCNQSLAAVLPNDTYDSNFLYYNLSSRYEEIRSLSGGEGRSGLNLNLIKGIQIFLPPLDSQSRIARIIKTVDDAIDITQKVIDKTEKLKKSLLQKIFAENSYPTIKLAETDSNIQYGYTASAMTENTGVKMLRITDVQNGLVNWDSVPYCECSPESFDKYKLQQGDIVFARTGATTGKSYRVIDDQDSVFASYLIRVRAGSKLDSAYLSYFFQSPTYWKQITSGIEGGAQGGFNSTKLGQLNVPLPALPKQIRIASLLTDIDRKLELNKRTRFEQQRLKESLMQDLLTGKVQV